MVENKTREAGFGIVGIVAVVIVVVAVAGVGFAVFKKSSDTKNATTSATTPGTKTPVTQPSTQPQQAEDPYQGMTKYANAKYGFSFYYPSSWRLEERDPVASSFETDKTELSIWLVNTTTKTPTDAAIITVNGADLAYFTKRIEDEAGSYAAKSVVTISGKNAVKFTIPQGAKTSAVKREMYFVAAGGKTYAVQSTNEETNQTSSPSYMGDIGRLINSFKLP
jgi:hypothetical protein